MQIGFTGTRFGMTKSQMKGVEDLFLIMPRLWDGEVVSLGHGDCKGSDEQAHEIWIGVYGPDAPVQIYPPEKEIHRAFCGSIGSVILPPQDYLARDREIVHNSQLVIATPHQNSMVNRSGTWYTVRYAWKTGVPTIVVPPSR